MPNRVHLILKPTRSDGLFLNVKPSPSNLDKFGFPRAPYRWSGSFAGRFQIDPGGGAH